MTDTTYNGWTNRETWAIGLHLMDDVTSWIQNDIGEWKKDESKDAGQLFRDLVDDMIEQSDLAEDYSLLLDLIDLSAVNWDELGQHALDAVFD
jgi:hypothetical protein